MSVTILASGILDAICGHMKRHVDCWILCHMIAMPAGGLGT